MAKRPDISSSRASLSPSTCEAARSRAETIWFCFLSITARAAGLDRKANDWLATSGKRAESKPFQSPGRVVAGYSLMPNMPA